MILALLEENYIEKISAYTMVDWKPLLELIPKIEGAKIFGRVAGVDKDKNKSNTFPYQYKSEIVRQFLKIVYDISIIISFDWGSWDEGRKMARADFDFDSIDIPTKCKLIAALVRNDRFCDGAIAQAIASEVILQMLKSKKRQLENNRI